MENLKQFIVDYQVTYHCVGKRGLFHKKEYLFDFSVCYDEATHFEVNTCTVYRALSKTRKLVEKRISKLLKQYENEEYFRIAANTAPRGDFKWSPRIYQVKGVDIKLLNIGKGVAWKEKSIKSALEHLSIEEFKRVYNEVEFNQESN